MDAARRQPARAVATFQGGPLFARLFAVRGVPLGRLAASVLAWVFLTLVLYRGVTGESWIWVALIPLVVADSMRTIRVGIDGVEVRGLGGRFFYPHPAIDKVVAAGDTIHVVMKDHTSIALATPQAAEVAEVCRSFVSGSAAQDVLALRRERGGRSDREWLMALAASKGERVDTYRDAPLRADDLWEVVEEPGYAREVKAAAAMKLRAKMNDDDRVRLRRAAASCASEELESALLRAADAASSEEELEAATRVLRGRVA